MSTLAEKMELPQGSEGPARCTLKQLLDRVGVRMHSEGATVICMGVLERWVKVSADTYELVESQNKRQACNHTSAEPLPEIARCPYCGVVVV